MREQKFDVTFRGYAEYHKITQKIERVNDYLEGCDSLRIQSPKFSAATGHDAEKKYAKWSEKSTNLSKKSTKKYT